MFVKILKFFIFLLDERKISGILVSSLQKNIAASVAKLVDAIDSKSVGRDAVLVQVRPEVPKHTTPTSGVVFLFVSKRLCEFDN